MQIKALVTIQAVFFVAFNKYIAIKDPDRTWQKCTTNNCEINVNILAKAVSHVYVTNVTGVT
jgi:hypothetical protein